jgi:hypothetical protein
LKGVAADIVPWSSMLQLEIAVENPFVSLLLLE